MAHMTVEEIQRFLRTLHLESLERSVTLRDREPNSDFRAIFAELESHGIKQVKPSPGRTALTLASLSFEDQEQIEGYVQGLVNESQVLCAHLQERCPMLRLGAIGGDALLSFERWYRAQYHAMARLRRRCDERQWVHAHLMKARRWVEEAYVESVN